MTPSPVLPTPVVGPINVSGGTGDWTASGQSPASGLPAGAVTGAFSGAHYIEEQEMTISYFRYPDFQFQNVTPQDTSLSATFPKYTVVSGTNTKTRIAYRVQASVTARKSYDSFSTSSFQQPQTFQVLAASADVLGNTYGDVPQGALGPIGQIVTSQKFLNRRPWESTDVEINESLDGFSTEFRASGGPVNGSPYIPTTTPELNQDVIFGKTWVTNQLVRKFPELAPGGAWGAAADILRLTYNHNQVGTLWGPYKSPNDQASTAILLLDEAGGLASTGRRLFDWQQAVPGTWHQATGNLMFSSTMHCPSYTTSRHDYS